MRQVDAQEDVLPPLFAIVAIPVVICRDEVRT